MSTPTNADRAEWAKQALETFPAADSDDVYTNAKDLITDLCHLVRREGGDPEFDAEGFATSAAMMHDMERDEDDED